MQQRGSSDERVTHFQSFHDALRKGHRLDELGVTRRTLQFFSARFAFALFSCLSRICGAFGGLSREKNEFAEHLADSSADSFSGLGCTLVLLETPATPDSTTPDSQEFLGDVDPSQLPSRSLRSGSYRNYYSKDQLSINAYECLRMGTHLFHGTNQ